MATSRPAPSLPRPVWRSSVLALLCAFGASGADAATFSWDNETGNWSVPGNWLEAVAPSGTDPTDVLVFAGDVSLPYFSTNNLLAGPTLINQLEFNATDNALTGGQHVIDGNTIALGGAAPQIVQNDTGNITINAPLQLRAALILTGLGDTVTMNGAVSGAFNITKTGTSTFRFGSLVTGVDPDEVELPSANTWVGTLTINDGAIRFNNNAASGRTALRANPVVFGGPNAALTVRSELRVGVLSGAMGFVGSTVDNEGADNENIVIHALSNGTYGGTILLSPPPFGGGNDRGALVIRGAATQTFTGLGVQAGDGPALLIEKDIEVGRSATLVLAGNASLNHQFTNAGIVLNGGTFRLDNTVLANPAVTDSGNRLRDGDAGSTGLDSIGGGLFQLVGNAVEGILETVGRVQLGSGGGTPNPRSGALTINITHLAGANASTALNFASLARDGTGDPTFATIAFTANDGAGAPLNLGSGGPGARISFNLAPPVLANGLFRNTSAAATAGDVGWATVQTPTGSAFATHGGFGVAPVAINATPVNTGTGDANANAQITGAFNPTNAAGYALNSLRIVPTAAGQTLTLANALNTNAIILAGSNSFTIGGAGTLGGADAGGHARYVHVDSATLTVSAGLGGANLPIVKSGAGVLALTNTGNPSLLQPTVINAGVVRAQQTTLPGGEVRFRGGVLELTGGGTFTRTIGGNSMQTVLNRINWSGIDNSGLNVGEDRGSGGFAAFGADVTIDLVPVVAGATTIAWESLGFLNSGHALMFGSSTGTHKVTWSDNLSLTDLAANAVVNYNAREIRVTDNAAVTTDRATISGSISGNVQSDLLKTGAGILELTGTNTYLGATQVHEGTLLVNKVGGGGGSIAASFLTDVLPGATLGGDGTLGAVKVEVGGRVSPGTNLAANTATLTTNGLSLSGAGARYELQIGGVTAGTLYDQIVVNGTVSLNGGDLIGLKLNAFTAVIGQMFFVIVNDGNDAVEGKFAQGDTATLSGQLFNISYIANSAANSITGGNDVALYIIPEPSMGLLAMAGTGLLLTRRRRRSGK